MNKPDHSKRAHALLSASGASRWLNCTPSPRLEDEIPDSPSSDFAEEGTLAHEFGDIGLQYTTKKIRLPKYNGLLTLLRTNKYYTDEMEDQVQKYIDYCMESLVAAKKKTKSAIMSIEDKVDLTYYVADGFGTNDCMILSDDVLEVIDLKYGKGIKVDADNNPQLMLYGLGALRAQEIMYDIETVRLTIVQPRLDHISSWDISADDLRSWGENEVRPKAELAYKGEGEQKAGDWCRWCKVKAQCRALAEDNLRIAQHEFKDPPLLDDAELLDVYQQIGRLTDWANSVSAHVLKEALAGKKWEGYKLVEGRSIRKISDTDKAIEILKGELFTEEDFIEKKLIALGKIEKLVGKKEFPELFKSVVIKPEGKPTLALESDKRPEINRAVDDFGK